MRRFGWHGSDLQWCAIISATFVTLLLVNPLGYIGGGWDDWQYLEASRCWVEHGPCLPRTHWEGRWPVFAPIAAIVSVLGESRTTVGLWPLMASIAAIALLVLVGNRIAGRPAGWLAGLLFLVTPAFSIQILDPSVEAIELALILGGVLCIARWMESRTMRWAFFSGFCFAIAFQVRETSVIAAVLAGLFVLTRKPRPADLAVAALGFALPMAIELLVYWNATGDPLFRWRLSLAHAQIPSSELPGQIDRSQSPFFNMEYIANWRHQPGVQVHWAIDGLLNLFINGKAGLSLALVPLLALAERKRITPNERRQLAGLYGLAILYAAILIYVFAMDPKARIMFPTLSAACLAFAIILNGFQRSSLRLLLLLAFVMHLLFALAILYVHQQINITEHQVRRWIAAYPGRIEIDPNTRRHLALVKEAERLPGPESDREFLILKSSSPCSRWARNSGLPDGALTTIDRAPLSRFEQVASWKGASVCLFRYDRPIGERQLLSAIVQSRPDGVNVLDPNIYRDPKRE